MLCPFRKQTTTRHEIKTVYRDQIQYPENVTINEDEFLPCYEDSCALYCRAAGCCKFRKGNGNYG